MLGAAVIDDVIGLIILAVVSDVFAGGEVTMGNVTRNTLTAFGFIIAAVLIGSKLVPPLVRVVARYGKAPSLPVMALTLAFLVAVLADRVGSALIIGAFTAGLLFAPTPQVHQIEEGVVRIGYFFVPLFFVHVGALVDARAFADPRVLLVGGILTLCAVVGKVVAGWAPFWWQGRKHRHRGGDDPAGRSGAHLRDGRRPDRRAGRQALRRLRHDGHGNDLPGADPVQAAAHEARSARRSRMSRECGPGFEGLGEGA